MVCYSPVQEFIQLANTVFFLTVCVSFLHHGRALHSRRNHRIYQNSLDSFPCCWRRVSYRCNFVNTFIYSVGFLFAVGRVGALYLYSADNIRKGANNGLEGALGVCLKILLLCFLHAHTPNRCICSTSPFVSAPSEEGTYPCSSHSYFSCVVVLLRKCHLQTWCLKVGLKANICNLDVLQESECTST